MKLWAFCHCYFYFTNCSTRVSCLSRILWVLWSLLGDRPMRPKMTGRLKCETSMGRRVLLHVLKRTAGATFRIGSRALWLRLRNTTLRQGKQEQGQALSPIDMNEAMPGGHHSILFLSRHSLSSWGSGCRSLRSCQDFSVFFRFVAIVAAFRLPRFY